METVGTSNLVLMYARFFQSQEVDCAILPKLYLILYVLLLTGMDNYDYTLPPEKIAFIAYNIGVYETVQKFGESIIKGKITPNMDISRIAEVLSESYSFYDS